MSKIQGNGTAQKPWLLKPVLEVLGLAEVEHQPKNNRMRAR